METSDVEQGPGAIEVLALQDPAQVQEQGELQLTGEGSWASAPFARMAAEIGLTDRLELGIGVALGEPWVAPGAELAWAPVLNRRWVLSVRVALSWEGQLLRAEPSP